MDTVRHAYNKCLLVYRYAEKISFIVLGYMPFVFDANIM
jgi:hypothetical protein